MTTVLTERLELRLPDERDRSRFVELFCNEDFMVYSGGVLEDGPANERFERMLANAADVPFAKQPIIERTTGLILGYSGVAWFEFDGDQQLEFGYRLASEARGKGYATEAGLALLDVARSTHQGVIYAMIDPRNEPSQRVADKLGFQFWKLEEVHGYVDRLYRLTLP